MKSKLRKLLFSTALLLAVAIPARAGLQADVTLTGGTNNCAAVTTNAYHTGSFANVTSREVSLQLSCNMSNVVATTIPYTLDTSDDNVLWATNAIVITSAATIGGSNVVSVVATNFGGTAFFRFGEFRNTNVSYYATNITFKVFTKPGL